MQEVVQEVHDTCVRRQEAREGQEVVRWTTDEQEAHGRGILLLLEMQDLCKLSSRICRLFKCIYSRHWGD